MAPTGDGFLDRFEAVLPPLDVRVRGETVLDEMQCAAGFEDAPDLPECGVASGMVHIVHVDSAVSKLLSGKGSDWPSRPDRSIGAGRRRQPLAREFPAEVGGFDGAHRIDGGRVERDVETRAEADFDHAAVQAGADASRDGSRELGIPQLTFDESRNDLVV